MEPDAAPAGEGMNAPFALGRHGAPPAGTMTCREELADGERYPLMKRISRRKRGPVPEDAANKPRLRKLVWVARREAPVCRKARGTN